MLVLNIGASLLAFFSFIKFLDGVVMWFGHFAGADELSFSYILGYAMYPIAWLIGIDLQVETDTLHSIPYTISDWRLPSLNATWYLLKVATNSRLCLYILLISPAVSNIPSTTDLNFKIRKNVLL